LFPNYRRADLFGLVILATENPAHCQAATAAETFAMHRMTLKTKATPIVALAMAFAVLAAVTPATAAPPDVRQANYDFEASGFVTPAGQIPPSLYHGGVAPVGYQLGGGLVQGGCDAGCDSTS